MTLAQSWADMRLLLCREYPALDPVKMLDYPLVDVLDLIKDHMDYNRRKPAAQAATAPPSTQKKVIYRQADDSWF